MSDIPKSRKSHLFKMAAKIAVEQGKKALSGSKEGKFKKLLDQAEILVGHVGQLKGAAMKAIQSLSIEGYDFLPPEVIEILEKLQSQAPRVSNEVMMKQLKSELGEERFSQYKNLKEEPIASASIGQVYEAEIDGKSVVVKVQYPGVAESVDDDINTLKKLLKALVLVSQKKVRLDDLMEEARRVLKLETDYEYERDSLIRYKKLFEGSEYIIPDVYPEMTTKKVITLSKEKGLEFPAWVRSNPSKEARQKVADQLLNLYIKEFFENKLVQTDPNPANFLISERGEMILLDFGATLEFESSFVRDYQLLIRKVFSRDREAILKQIFQLGFLDKRETDEVKEVFIDFLILSMRPFEESRQPFDFSNGEYSQEVRSEAWRFSRMLKYSAPPKQLIFLHRKLGGIFMLLKKLDIKADLSEFRKNMIEVDYF